MCWVSVDYSDVKNVKDKKRFLLFVKLLLEDRQKVENMEITLWGTQGDWANNTISDFLEASLACAEDTDYQNKEIGNPWNEFANFLLDGKTYE